jgi:signal peptidase I
LEKLLAEETSAHFVAAFCLLPSAFVNMNTQPKPSEPTESSTPPTLLARLWRQWGENIQILVLALGLALLIRTFIAEPRYIPSESMFPTLFAGDRLVVEKISYYLHPPQPGDIVVFAPPPQLQEQGFREDQAFIKRVIGLSGDRVRVSRGKVSVNDRVLSEPYIAEAPDYELPTVTVPPDRVFVMGDNRNNSNDSHIWGFLPQGNIVGRAVFRFWPIERFGGVK